MRVEKNDAWMRQRARIFHALARNRRVARACIDVLRVSIDTSNTLPMRMSFACDARGANAMRLRCSTWPTTCARRAASRVPRRMRERQNAQAHRDEPIGCACMPIAIRSVTPPSRCVWANASLTRIEIVRMQLRRHGDANVRCDLIHCGKTLFSND